MKKWFITEAIVSGELYLGNVASLFRPSKGSTILKSFFWSPLQPDIFFCNITDLLLLIAFFYSHTTFWIHIKVNSETNLTPKWLIFTPHWRCERTLHSLALVHWWPQRTTNISCHQQLGPHNTKHKPESQTPHYNKHHHHISPRCLTHCTTGHHGQLNTLYYLTTYPSSPQLTYDMTTDYNKPTDFHQL